MKKSIIITFSFILLFSSQVFAGYYLHVVNLATNWGPQLNTLNMSTSHEKIIDPKIYPTKITTTVKFYSTSSVVTSGAASITIGTEDEQHFCKFHMHRYTKPDNYDQFSELKVTERKNAHCDFLSENSNTGKLFIYD